MTLKSKFMILLATIVASMFGVIALYQYTNSRAAKRETQKDRAMQLLVKWDALNNYTKDLLISSRNLQYVQVEWKRAMEDFDLSLQELVRSQFLHGLGETLSSSLENTGRLWGVTRAPIRDVQEALDRYLEQHLPLAETEVGLLLRYEAARAAPDTLPPAELVLLTRVVQGLVNVSRSNDSFVIVLTITSELLDSETAEYTRRAQWVCALLSLMIVVLTGLVVWHFAHAVANRIQTIEGAMRTVAGSGFQDFTARPAVTSRDEVGSLAHYCNEFLDELKRVYGALAQAKNELEKRVEERTTQLTATNQHLQRVIEERIKVEESLRESEENLVVTLDSIGDGVIVTDADERIRRMNPVAQDLTGWSAADGLGKPLPDVFSIIDPETRGPAPDPVENVLQEGHIWELKGHVLLVARDGQERQIADSAAPIRNRHGTLLGVVLVFRDVTEQHKLEQQVREAQKMEAIGRLAGGVAHDFNNMLAGIIGFAELLRARQAQNDDGCRPYTESILETAARAAGLVQKLLAFSRRGKIQSVPVDAHRLIDDVIAILAHSIDRRIEICQQLTANSSLVLGDPSQLQSAILNLGLNARDAMPDGGRLTFSTANVRLDDEFCLKHSPDVVAGYYLEISVADTGVGMDRGTMTHLFEPFFTTKGVGKGTGLGLAAAYGTVKEHRGVITVYSEPGQGSVFKVFLPLSGTPAESSKTEENAVVTGTGCVLLVDDEEVLRRMAQEMLEGMGYRVLLAENGEQAVDTYRSYQRRIDLILMDMVMPKMNGREAFFAIRKINPEAKVILSSGFTFNLDDGELQAAGVNEFIQKPYRLAELSRKIASVMGLVE